MSYLSDAVDSIIQKNGFGNGAEAASTAGKFLKSQIQKTDAPAPSQVSAAVEKVDPKKEEKIFGMPKKTAFIVLGAIAVIAIVAMSSKKPGAAAA